MIVRWITLGAAIVFLVSVTSEGALAVSEDNQLSCRTWKWANPDPNVRDLTAVTHGGPGTVAVGDYGSVFFSPDGISWSEVESGTHSILRDVVWTGKDYVAVGDHGSVVRSTDGVSWTALATNIVVDLTCLASGNGVLVAGGPKQTILTSVDGETWTTSEVGYGSTEFTDFVWTGACFVGVGESVSAVSPDGENWNWDYSGPLDYRDVWNLAWNGSVVAAVSDNTNVAVSSDGLQWDLVFDSVPYIFAEDLVWTGSSFVAVGGGWAWVSADLSSWVPIVLVTDDGLAALHGVTWTGELLVGVGSSGSIGISPTGVDWLPAQIPGGSTTPFFGVAGGNGIFAAVSVADKDTYAVSDDGLGWAVYTGAGRFRDVTFGGGRFVGVGMDGIAGTSMNGVDWDLADSGANHLHGVTWDGKRYIAVTYYDGSVHSSVDAKQWVLEDEDDYDYLNGVCAGDGTTVAVGSTNVTGNGLTPIVVSGQPGGPWQRDRGFFHLGLYDHSLYDVAFGANRWVAVGSAGLILTSEDLVQWEITDIGEVRTLYWVEWNGSEFLAGGASGLLLASGDGSIWSAEDVPVGVMLRGGAWLDDSWVVVGSWGAILRGACKWPQERPVAGFEIIDNPSMPGEVVRFEDLATGYVTSWQWQFGGQGQSTASNPRFVFEIAGDYEVTQTVCNDVGCDSALNFLSVVPAPPRAVLSWLGPDLFGGREEHWRDLSTGPPDRWLWSFGDGNTSTERHPIHVFDAPGIYRVELEVGNGVGDDVVDTSVVVGTPPIVTENAGFRPRDIAWNGEMLLATWGYRTLTSVDGHTWSIHEREEWLTPDGLTWAGDRFVAVAGDWIATTVDGVLWEQTTVPVSNLRDVASNGVITVAVGDSGVVVYSYDLVDWWTADSGVDDDLQHIAANSNLFVITTRYGDTNILESADGISWTPAHGEISPAKALTWNGEGFYVRMGDGVFRREANGAWGRVDTPLNAQNMGVSPGDAGLAVVSGQLLASDFDALWWYATALKVWVQISESGGLAMTVTDDAVYLIDDTRIRRLGLGSGIAALVFADGFETGNTGAWSENEPLKTLTR